MMYHCIYKKCDVKKLSYLLHFAAFLHLPHIMLHNKIKVKKMRGSKYCALLVTFYRKKRLEFFALSFYSDVTKNDDKWFVAWRWKRWLIFVDDKQIRCAVDWSKEKCRKDDGEKCCKKKCRKKKYRREKCREEKCREEKCREEKYRKRHIEMKNDWKLVN